MCGDALCPPSGEGVWGCTVCPPSGEGVWGRTVCPPSGEGVWGRTVCPPSGEGVWGCTVCPPSGEGVWGCTVCPPSGEGVWGCTVCPPSGEGVCGDALCARPLVRVCGDAPVVLPSCDCSCRSLSPSALCIPSRVSVYLVLLLSPCLRAWSAVLGTLPTLGFDVACHINKYQVTHYTDLDLTSVPHQTISDHTHICTLNPGEASTTVSYIVSEAEA